MNGTQLIAQILKDEGVEWMACFPSNPLIEEVAKIGIRPIAFRHERGGVMAADGFSRVSDRKRFGVFCMQNQAGAENAMGGISQAFSDNVPILLLPGGTSSDRITVRPEFSAAQNYQGITKQVEQILRPDQVTNVMRRAFHGLRNGRPGPVAVEMLSDICNQEVPEGHLAYHSPNPIRQVPTRGDIKDTIKILLSAKRPVIWAGMGVLLSGASAELTEFAELMNIPVYTTMPGKSSIDERHPLSLGAGSGATTLAARTWLQTSDVLFAIGSSLTMTPYAQPIPAGKTLIQNVASIEDINKDYDISIGLAGDTKETLAALIDEAKGQLGDNGRKGRTDVSSEIEALKQQWMAEWLPILTSNEEPLNPYRVVLDINNTIDKENSIVTHDAGAPRDTILPFFTATVPHSYIGWGKSTHLGYGIPLMIGAKLAEPNKFCLNYMGDGAFGMSGMDLETSARIGAPITTVLLNNGGMATYPGGFPTAREVYGVSHMIGDYSKIAEGMGAVGITVTKTNEMVPALKEAQKLNLEGKAVLIDVHTRFEPKRSRY
jgi:thiamine pyrophosphate-dependent acetolactate synthase large subunit-like protein